MTSCPLSPSRTSLLWTLRRGGGGHGGGAGGGDGGRAARAAPVLRALQLLEFTVDAIRVTEIGTAVKPLRKHRSTLRESRFDNCASFSG
uniref:TFIIS N-terminal domain-containing protein n=1 Tax=Oryza rufipogon TaxID=4529 RepID=A0A0E0RBU9_ORYRU